MTSKRKRTTTKGPVRAFPVPPEGYQLLFTVTCTSCGAKEPTFSLEGRFPGHCSPTNGKSACVRSGAEFLPGEKRRVQWRVVEKIAIPGAGGRDGPPAKPRAKAALASSGKQTGKQTIRRPKNPTVSNPPASTGVTRTMSRLEVERRYYFSDFEESNEARYREWQELNTGSVSVVARPSDPQGTGRRR